MNSIVAVGDRTLAASELFGLMTQYQLLPTFLKELILDNALKDIVLTPDEEASALDRFYVQHQIGSDEQRQSWLNYYRINPEQLLDRAQREFKLAKFKDTSWGAFIEVDFLKHKPKLDQFIYSLIRTRNVEQAQELYFRLKEGEQTFADIASQYSEGPEAQTGGQVGPVAAATLHPSLVQMLASSKPGQIWPPQRFGEWSVIVRLETCMSAQLNEAVRQQLLERRYQEWLDLQLQSMAT
ncbi:peptidylprolyl isomerase [Altericista sp. CCNU0014]|uniref:peptidylprolyl isomerase n=1 Tax=Altericista sp. CCNU0014 TaxID=3082949 RepID=UPI00384F6457